LCEYVGDSFCEDEGLQYFQSHLVKQQDTKKKTFLDTREVQKYEGWQQI
jgi:hypothetical protein